METNKMTILHVEDSTTVSGDYKAQIIEDGQRATNMEHTMSLRRALRIYPKAIVWSVGISTAVVMLGYETALLSNFFAYPPFRKKYGQPDGALGYQLSAPWQSGLANSSTVGLLIGLIAAGYFVDAYGHRRISLISYAFMTAFIFITFFAKSVEILLVGEILCGIPWGVFSILGPAYASEVMPVVLRGYLTSYVNACWILGAFIASGVLNGLMHRTDQWGYRLPFAIQWVWPVLLATITYFAPESPWWLVRRNKLSAAGNSLKRLAKADEATDHKATIAMMVHTNELERELETGTSYWDCFRGVDRRRTEICVMVFAIQHGVGLSFSQYCTYFMEQAGLDASDSFKMGLGYNAIALIGTILSWFLLTKFGRRTLYVTGLGLLTIIMLVVGFASIAPSSNIGAIWAQSGLILCWILCFDLTIGPVAFTVASETSSTRLRGKTLALGRGAEAVLAIVAQTVNPYMLNPGEGNWKGKTAFFWAGSSVLCFIWAYFRLPECKGRTYEELDLLFQRHTPTRAFKTQIVDAYSVDKDVVLLNKSVNKD